MKAFSSADEQIVTIIGLIGIALVVIAGLVVVAVNPTSASSVIAIVACGVTASGALARRQPPGAPNVGDVTTTTNQSATPQS